MHPDHIQDLYTDHHSRLWRLCYHITGSRSDAEDCMQQTFERLITRPPKDLSSSLAPWLTRVATNLAYDHLRTRHTRTYHGTWLPEPVATSQFAIDSSASSPEAHHDRKQAISYAMMVALETLNPKARVIWILRDIYGATTAECAQWLSIGLSDVKTTLHRARAAMTRAQDEVEWTQSPQALEQAWMAWLNMLAQPSPEALLAMLEEDIIVQGDAKGQYTNAYRPILGAVFAARFFMGLGRKTIITNVSLLDVNGAPALLLNTQPQSARHAPATLCIGHLSEDNLWKRLYVINAPEKLEHLISTQ